MKNLKYFFKSFSQKNSKFVDELSNTINNVKIEKKHVVDSDFDNKNNDELVFEISDSEEMISNENVEKKHNFDFKKIEKRNKELNKNTESDPALQQLKNMIAFDQTRQNKMEFKDLNLVGQGKSEAPIEEDQYLVKRPSKSFVWGLGQQTKNRKCNFFLN